MNYEKRLDILYDLALYDLSKKTDEYGKESIHSNIKVLTITDDELMFNLEGGRYLIEINGEELFDNKGYSYAPTVLDTEDFFKVVDHINSIYPEYVYNSHGHVSTFDEIKQLEIERENYTEDDFNKWAEKYNINGNSKVIWVSDRSHALTYAVDASEVDYIMEMNDDELDSYQENHNITLYQYPYKCGDLIRESCDGDFGYLLILER